MYLSKQLITFCVFISVLTLSFFSLIIAIVRMCGGEELCQCVHIRIIGQLCEVGSLLLLYGFWQAPLPAEPLY